MTGKHKERIAIFGGTFDPVHMAHLRAAQEAAEEIGLNKVLFMPCAQPPHPKHVMASAKDRLRMLELAVADNPIFGVSDLEARLGGTSYTVRTLEAIHNEQPEAQIFFLIGADAFFYLHTWHEPHRLFDYADFVVMARPKSPRTDVLEYMQKQLDPDFAPAGDGWIRRNGGHGAKRVSSTLLSISSTDIRRRAAEGLSLTYLVPPAVEDYIKSMKLYNEPAAASTGASRVQA
jgi:nicotinate-nucleotide adenylyltransferase